MDPISVISCVGGTGTIQKTGSRGSLWSPGNLPLMPLHAPLLFNAHQVQINFYSLFLLLFRFSYCGWRKKNKTKEKQGNRSEEDPMHYNQDCKTKIFLTNVYAKEYLCSSEKY